MNLVLVTLMVSDQSWGLLENTGMDEDSDDH